MPKLLLQRQALRILLGAALLVHMGIRVIPVCAQDVLWEQTAGPVNGYATHLQARSDGYVFGLVSERLYRSADDGHTWTRAPLPQGGLALLAGTEAGDLFTASIIFCHEKCHQDGVFHSDDSGNTWRPIQIGPAGNTVALFTVGAGGRVFAYTGDGVYLSDTGDETWHRAPLDTARVPLRMLASRTDGLVGGVTNDAVYLSTDNGETWTRSAIETANLFVDRLALFDEHTLFGDAVGELVRSTDGGRTWASLTLPVDPGMIYDLQATASGHLRVGTDRGGFESGDAGETWTTVAPRGLGVYTFATAATGDLLVGTADAVYRRRPDGTWLRSSTGIIETQVQALTLLSDGDLLAGTFFDGLYRTSDGGRTWNDLLFPVSTSINAMIDLPDGGGLAGVSGEPGLYRLAAGDTTWTPAGLRNIGSLATDAHQTLFAGAVGRVTHGVYRSTDLGASWERVGLESEEITELAAAPSGTIYAGTLGDGMYRSMDAGDTWQHAGLPGENVRALATSIEGNVFAGTIDGDLFRSEEGGDTWTEVLAVDAGVWDLLVGPGSVVFAGTDTGVWRSTDAGSTWHTVSEGLPEALSVRSLARDENGYLYAGTRGRGVYRTVDPVATSIAHDRTKPPSTLSLQQNYPNPVAAVTTIAFDLPAPTSLRLSLYDASGREVAVLASGTYPAGRHAVVWDARECASGVYLYRLQASGRAVTQRLILNK